MPLMGLDGGGHSLSIYTISWIFLTLNQVKFSLNLLHHIDGLHFVLSWKQFLFSEKQKCNPPSSSKWNETGPSHKSLQHLRPAFGFLFVNVLFYICGYIFVLQRDTIEMFLGKVFKELFPPHENRPKNLGENEIDFQK